ncbi:unnamed protein product [Meganyctiphanes norvegica]|uniref:XK-related protein n=1 Tax=Meganyctiphanes norvegica TaxID=48144 RepID=A0AAV2PJI7_MEGNR
MEHTDNTSICKCVPNSISKAFTQYGERVSKKLTQFNEYLLKYKRSFIIIKKLIGLLFYVLDFGTDIFTAVLHLSRKNNWWGGLTVAFTVIPMVSLSFGLNIYASFGSEGSVDLKCLPLLTSFICAPIVPFGWLVLDLVAFITSDDPDNRKDNSDSDDNVNNGNNDNNVNSDNNGNIDNIDSNEKAASEDGTITTAKADNITNIDSNENADTEVATHTTEKAADLLKLFVCVVESYPQAILQMFIVFQILKLGDLIDPLQWVKITQSLLSLSFTVSFGYLNHCAAISSKFVFFLCGLLAVQSRLMVCCVYSMTHGLLWLVPFGTEIFASAVVWSISSLCHPHDDTTHVGAHGHFYGIFIFMLTEAYNCFNLTGLLTSTISLGFAIGGLFLNVPPNVNEVNLAFAATSFAVNVLLAAAPSTKDIRKDWLRKHKVEETQL